MAPEHCKLVHHAIEGADNKDTEKHDVRNEPAPGVSYYTPVQHPPAGTAADPQPDGSHTPKLFQPLKIRGLTMQNRIMVSPMCQYSASNGHLTPWHFTHLGGILMRGPGLTMIEATSVTANGRITPEDSGLWQDSQIEPLAQVVEFAHSQGQKIGIQLSHAGRKASTVAPWLSGGDKATAEGNGWPEDVWAPSAVRYNERLPMPKEMGKGEIEGLKRAWGKSVERAVRAGVDAIEVHNGHGYLLHNFVSPATNHRTDEYGGSFENRIRLTLELVELTRKLIPEDMPLFLRISATDWLEHEPDVESWKSEDTIKLAEILATKGVDVLDVSTAGNHPSQKIDMGAPGSAYQAPFAKAVKDKLGDKLLVSSVGSIRKGVQANQLLEEDNLDLVVIGKSFLANPGLVFAFADELEVDVRMPNQIEWAFARGKKYRARVKAQKLEEEKAKNAEKEKERKDEEEEKGKS